MCFKVKVAVKTGMIIRKFIMFFNLLNTIQYIYLRLRGDYPLIKLDEEKGK